MINDSMITDTLKKSLTEFIRLTGKHNDTGSVVMAKYIADYLTSVHAKYKFSGELTNGSINHILIHYNGNYYDGIDGLVDPSDKDIIDNLEDNGYSIGDDDYGWIDYKVGNYDYRSSKIYALWNQILHNA